MGKFKLNFKLWYIGHIIGLVGIAFIGGHYLQDLICKSTQFCVEQFTPEWKMILVNLIYYSLLAWIYDSGFHSISGKD